MFLHEVLAKATEQSRIAREGWTSPFTIRVAGGMLLSGSSGELCKATTQNGLGMNDLKADDWYVCESATTHTLKDGDNFAYNGESYIKYDGGVYKHVEIGNVEVHILK